MASDRVNGMAIITTTAGSATGSGACARPAFRQLRSVPAGHLCRGPGGYSAFGTYCVFVFLGGALLAAAERLRISCWTAGFW